MGLWGGFGQFKIGFGVEGRFEKCFLSLSWGRSGFGRFVGEISFGSVDMGFGETVADFALSLGFIDVQLGRLRLSWL